MARRAYREAQRTGTAFDHAATDLLSRQRINIYSLELERFIPASSSICQSPPNSLTPHDDFVPKAEDMGPENCATLGNIRGRGPSPAMGGAERSEAFSGPIPSAGDGNGRNNRIHVADISAYDLPTAMMRVDCSKGTYIRALARDLGEALGSGAFLSSLRRTRNGGIPVEDALSLPDALAILQ